MKKLLIGIAIYFCYLFLFSADEPVYIAKVTYGKNPPREELEKYFNMAINPDHYTRRLPELLGDVPKSGTYNTEFKIIKMRKEWKYNPEAGHSSEPDFRKMIKDLAKEGLRLTVIEEQLTFAMRYYDNEEFSQKGLHLWQFGSHDEIARQRVKLFTCVRWNSKNDSDPRHDFDDHICSYSDHVLTAVLR